MVRPLKPREKQELREEIEANPVTNVKDGKEEIALIEQNLVTDILRGDMIRGRRYCAMPAVGEYFLGAPLEMETIFDFTGLRGSGPGIYFSLIYTLPKWRFVVRKVDEFLHVTPEYAEFYNLTVAQKQKLEGAIKQGLASAAAAVADYELVMHDSRRYREILDYFKKGKTDEHVLRSLFVDRVDAHTGEGYSLITMAKRWPTIITDFIRMKTEWTDPEVVPEKQVEKIKSELDISMAEATILKTKNELYREWKKLFFSDVKDRYARIENLASARKKSIDDYREWLKPYIASFKAIRETAEFSPSHWVTNAYEVPGFGQSNALTGLTLWAFKPFFTAERGKAEAIRLRKNFVIDPYDRFAKRWQKRIEYKYGVKFEEKDVGDLLAEATSKTITQEFPVMEWGSLYYIFFRMNVLLSLLRTPPPQGTELDNLMFFPFKTYLMSQNVMLLHLMELRAKEKNMEYYINEIIGAKEHEESILKHLEEEFEEKKPEKKKRLEAFKGRTGKLYEAGIRPKLLTVFHWFFRAGPYEPVFYERGSKMYSRAAGADFGDLVDFIKDKMEVD